MSQDKIWLKGKELKERWGIGEADLLHYIRTTDLQPHTKDFQVCNKDWVFQCASQHGAPLPQTVAILSWKWRGVDELLFHIDNVLEVESTLNLDISTDESQEPLKTKERQELGRLRIEKEKWELAINAAVHAALFCNGKEITRNQLSSELHRFKLPDTTIELIWKALRDKGLTKGSGRPKKK